MKKTWKDNGIEVYLGIRGGHVMEWCTMEDVKSHHLRDFTENSSEQRGRYDRHYYHVWCIRKLVLLIELKYKLEDEQASQDNVDKLPLLKLSNIQSQ